MRIARHVHLYSITKGQTAILEFTRATLDSAGNLPPLLGIFPDTMAPVVRTMEGERELTMMRWEDVVSWVVRSTCCFAGSPVTISLSTIDATRSNHYVGT